MRARVRKERGGFSPASGQDSRRGDGTASAAPDPVERHAAAEVEKDEGQGGNLPPWPALVAATIPKGARVFCPMADPTWKVRSGLDLVPHAGEVLVLDVDQDMYAPQELAEYAAFFTKGQTLVGYPDTPAAREAFSGLNVFKIAGAPDRLFAATYEPTGGDWLEKIGEHKKYAPDTTDLEELAKREVRLLKADDSDERLVYGIVLEPDGIDAQQDTISAAEIRQAAHKFLQDYGNVGLQHQTFINGKARILESYIAPADFDVGEQHVKKGTWLMAMRVLDDDIWAAVKDGTITGFSIGGTAVRVPAGVA